MADTKIQWATKVWSPVTGCTHAGSPGCDHCYAKRMSKRLRGRFGYPDDNPFRVTVHPDRLEEPLHWKKSQRIFVCSMGDLFHPDVTFGCINKVFSIMLKYWGEHNHTFMILTKRPERMLDWAKNHNQGFMGFMGKVKLHPDSDRTIEVPPPKHIWLGVSAENQQMFDERWAVLKQIPAALYMISYEPALGPLVLPPDFLALGKRAWVVVGGESGPGARPMHPDWARGVRDQCIKAGIPYFFKQFGAWKTIYDRDKDDPGWRRIPGSKNNNTRFLNLEGGHGFHGERVVFVEKVGKKAAGRTLDGKTWNQFPGG